MTRRIATLAGVAARALRAGRDFLRGFTGLAGTTPGAPVGAPPTTETAREALCQHAARRRSCC